MKGKIALAVVGVIVVILLVIASGAVKLPGRVAGDTWSGAELPFCDTVSECTSALLNQGLTQAQVDSLEISCSNSVCTTQEVGTYAAN